MPIVGLSRFGARALPSRTGAPLTGTLPGTTVRSRALSASFHSSPPRCTVRREGILEINWFALIENDATRRRVRPGDEWHGTPLQESVWHLTISRQLYTFPCGGITKEHTRYLLLAFFSTFSSYPCGISSLHAVECELSEEAHLKGGRVIPLLPEGHKGISEVLHHFPCGC